MSSGGADRASPAPSTRGLWTPAAVLALGVLSILMLVWVQWVSDRQSRQDLAIERSLNQLEVATVTSHLWLEEFLTGDPHVDLENEVWHTQDRAVEMIHRILHGGETEHDVDLRPLDDPRLRTEAEELETLLTGFRNLAVQRYAQRTVAGIGSDLDERYDATFRQVMALAATLRVGLSERMRDNRRSLHWRLRLIGGAWLLLIAAAVAGLWSRERRQQAAEAGLRQREEELLQAQKMEAVGRLAGGIAHDVNNYLGAIRGYCEVAKMKGERGADLARRMDAAIETSNKVSALIRQLLAFSRRQPARPKVIDLNRLVRDMERLMERLIGEEIVLETRLQPELWNVTIDPSQLEQTLVNLLVNARDAMPRGGRIVVATDHLELDRSLLDRHPSARPGRYVRLTVADGGTGIDPEIRDKIFEPFFTTKAEKGSSGLGLATVYGIVQQNGGFLNIDSEPGRGTTIEVYLPSTDRQPASLAKPDGGPVDLARPARILLVEDNDDMRASTQALLETLGHEVLAAANGVEALRLFTRGGTAFDLLITDVIMPDVGGKELFEDIRRRQPDLPCLFISGYSDDESLRRDLDLDQVHFLQKPFSFEALARAIHDVLGTEPDARSASA